MFLPEVYWDVKLFPMGNVMEISLPEPLKISLEYKLYKTTLFQQGDKWDNLMVLSYH